MGGVYLSSQSKARYLGYLRQDIARPIIVNSQNVLQFYVEFGCPRPNHFPAYVTCYATALEPFGFEDDLKKTDTDRTENLYNWLMDRILTFRVQNRSGYFSAADVAVHELNDKADLWEYEPVPVLHERMAVSSLEEALTKGTPLRGFDPPDRSPDLPFVVVADGAFRGPFDKLLTSGGSVGLRAGPTGLGRVEAIADGAEVIADEQVWFVERVRFRHLLQELNESVAKESALSIAAAALQVEAHDPPSAPMISQEAPGTQDAPPPPTQLERPETIRGFSEAAFLNRLQVQAQEEGLYFRKDDLINFHTALKTGSLVVLSGLSGTGKSRLVEVYRRALGLPDRSHFLWLSVRPNWNDDADLIGYYDPLNRLYRPGETGLVDLLLQASRSPNELFMVCLDEMNLARVEHYFSQFLSNMERPTGQRQLRLYAPELQSEVYNAHRYPPFIPLGPNVLFCGTINVDESTHSFSDKVLDRCNVIRMAHVDLRQWWQEVCLRHEDQAAAAELAPRSPQPMVAADQWHSWCTDFDPSPYGEQIALLQRLNELLGSAGTEKRFGYRVVRQILLYLHRLPQDESGEPLLDPGVGLDQQVSQRILTKVRGSGEDLRELFRPNGALETYLMQSNLSDFTYSLAEIRRKFTELEHHDFTS